MEYAKEQNVVDVEVLTEEEAGKISGPEIIDGFQTVFNELVVQKAAIAENLRQLGEVAARVNLLLDTDNTTGDTAEERTDA